MMKMFVTMIEKSNIMLYIVIIHRDQKLLSTDIMGFGKPLSIRFYELAVLFFVVACLPLVGKAKQISFNFCRVATAHAPNLVIIVTCEVVFTIGTTFLLIVCIFPSVIYIL